VPDFWLYTGQALWETRTPDPFLTMEREGSRRGTENAYCAAESRVVGRSPSASSAVWCGRGVDAHARDGHSTGILSGTTRLPLRGWNLPGRGHRRQVP
jgi:hypothetical protein